MNWAFCATKCDIFKLAKVFRADIIHTEAREESCSSILITNAKKSPKQVMRDHLGDCVTVNAD